MTQHVPDASRGTSLRGGAPVGSLREGAVHLASESTVVQPAFTAVPPAQAHSSRAQDGRKQRALGLIPATAGATFPIVVRAKSDAALTSRDISALRAELRRADTATRRLEAEITETTLLHGAHSEQSKAKQLEWDRTVAQAGIFRRRLADAETPGKVSQIHMAEVREPSSVTDALENTDDRPIVVCLHEECVKAGKQWASEREMRADHPKNEEMIRKQQAHVYVYRSEAPLDRIDPDGPKVGYIAPVGRDGTTVQQLAIDPSASIASDVDGLRDLVAAQGKQIADLMALLDKSTARK